MSTINWSKKKSISGSSDQVPTLFSKTYYIDMDPVAKGRVQFSRFSKSPYTPDKTREAEDLISAVNENKYGDHCAPLSGPLQASFLFVYACPSRKHTVFAKVTKPDASNLLKLVEDALNPKSYLGQLVRPGAYHDDAQIVFEQVGKVYCWGPIVSRGVYVCLDEMGTDDMEELLSWAEMVVNRVQQEEA